MRDVRFHPCTLGGGILSMFSTPGDGIWLMWCDFSEGVCCDGVYVEGGLVARLKMRTFVCKR